MLTASLGEDDQRRRLARFGLEGCDCLEGERERGRFWGRANPLGFIGGYVGGCEEEQLEMWGKFGNKER